MSDTAANPDPAKQTPAESDERLMLAFSQGSTEAFNQLFTRYKQPLFGFFRRRVTDPVHAEELTQETFLAVLRSGSRYQPRALFRTYLYAIGFKILRAYRRKAAFRATFLGSSAKAHEVAVRNMTDMEVSLRQALSKLELQEREILLLREFEELSYAEIATLLNLPLNTVRSRLFRARTALRELLSPHERRAENPQFTGTEERA
jgi:RNA polymerase sigma-70 factor, ECF subfamily